LKRHFVLFIVAGISGAFAQSGAQPIESPRAWGEFVRTYPVYFPGREPAGYWEMLRNAKPEPLITPGARTMADWVAVGKRVFRELDIPYMRSYDPKFVEILRDADKYKALGGHPQKDGTVYGLRWVPTSKGLALSLQDCGSCHSRIMPDGSTQDGARHLDSGDGISGLFTSHTTPGFLEFYSPGETPAMVAWRFWAAP
jgi:hypothetical protein